VTSGGLLREARTHARLSQTELAARAGIAQSVISAYESGKREPSLRTLERLVAATGGRLVLSVQPGPPAGIPDSPLGRRLRQRRRRVLEIAAAHGLRNVRVFGSVARGEDTVGSDVDLLVDVPEGTGLFTLVRAEREIGEVLGTRVELVPADTVKAHVRPGAERDAIPL
jgi:hypothetical protein